MVFAYRDSYLHLGLLGLVQLFFLPEGDIQSESWQLLHREVHAMLVGRAVNLSFKITGKLSLGSLLECLYIQLLYAIFCIVRGSFIPRCLTVRGVIIHHIRPISIFIIDIDCIVIFVKVGNNVIWFK